jgi:Histidine kinase-, DNA gyrase B-, and HSP90-like ATPase
MLCLPERERQRRGDGRSNALTAMEPFFTTKEPGKGTGLGLPMVHGLAEQTGGLFILKSRPKEGTTAELWLPVDESARSVIERQIPTREFDKPQPSLVILAVDDDSLVLTNTPPLAYLRDRLRLKLCAGRTRLIW